MAVRRVNKKDLSFQKTYLLPLIRLQLRKVAGVQETPQRLMVRFALHCETDVDSGFVRAVQRAVHSN